MKKSPGVCAESGKAEAAVCRFCQNSFTAKPATGPLLGFVVLVAGLVTLPAAYR